MDKNSDHLDVLRSLGHNIVNPIYVVVDYPQKIFSETVQSFRDRLELLTENKRLADDNRILSYDARRFNSVRNENNRLRRMLESSSSLNEAVEVANVLQVNNDPSARVVFLDKGSRGGVFVGQAVVDAEGVVGQIIKVSHFVSTVLLVTDKNHAIPIVIDRNGLRSIAAGSKRDKLLSLMFLGSSDDVRVGDKVVSSGLGKVFPKGYPVGSVVSVEPSLDTDYLTVRILPASKIGQFREVLLVIPDEASKLPVLESRTSK